MKLVIGFWSELEFFFIYSCIGDRSGTNIDLCLVICTWSFGVRNFKVWGLNMNKCANKS